MKSTCDCLIANFSPSKEKIVSMDQLSPLFSFKLKLESEVDVLYQPHFKATEGGRFASQLFIIVAGT